MEEKQEAEDFKRIAILVLNMIHNAPKDSKENIVVEVGSIKNFGIFYVFLN